MAERLHLDLSAGARGEMIAGALLAVGADPRAAVDALAATGLSFVELAVDPVRRGGLIATRVRFVVDGVELAGPSAVDPPADRREARGPRGRPESRHAKARPRLHEAQRGPVKDAKTAAGVAEDPGGGRSAPRTGPTLVVEGMARSGKRTADDGGDKGKGKGARGSSTRPARTGARRARTPSTVEAWRAGDAARPSELVDVLRTAALGAVPKALAVRAARRIVDGLTAVAGNDARLHGPRALRILCELVAGAALVDALSPALVTASPIALSRVAVDDEGVVDAALWPAPSPWLLEVLAGVPVVEREDAVAFTDVAGGALAWACAHRFGARGIAAATKQGAGAGLVDAAGMAVVARALRGPPPAVKTRAGERTVETMCDLAALVPVDVERAALVEALAALGMRNAALGDVVDGAGKRALSFAGSLPAPAVDDAAALLWRAGALDVKSSWVEVLTPAVVEVTVPVGRGRTKTGVRVRVWRDPGDGDRIARIEPDGDDVRAAALSQRCSVHEVAAAAVAGVDRFAGLTKSAFSKAGDAAGVEGDDDR